MFVGCCQSILRRCYILQEFWKWYPFVGLFLWKLRQKINCPMMCVKKLFLMMLHCTVPAWQKPFPGFPHKCEGIISINNLLAFLRRKVIYVRQLRHVALNKWYMLDRGDIAIASNFQQLCCPTGAGCFSYSTECCLMYSIHHHGLDVLSVQVRPGTVGMATLLYELLTVSLTLLNRFPHALYSCEVTIQNLVTDFGMCLVQWSV